MARRSGGREARKALRSAPLAEETKPVHPGESGGQYRPLTESGIAAVNENVLRILEEIGFNDATPHCIETCTAVGAIMGNDGRLRMPRAVVQNALELAARNLTLHAQDPQYDLDLSGSRVHFSTAGAAVMIADPINNRYRDSTAQDLYDMARIVDTCEHIHMFQRMCVLRDVGNTYEMDLNTTYCSVVGYEQARRRELGQYSQSRQGAGNAAHHCRRRGAMAGAAVCQPVELLCRAADEICAGCARVPAGCG